MNTRSCSSTLITTLLALAMRLFTAAAQKHHHYKLFDTGTLGGPTSSLGFDGERDLNNQGTLVSLGWRLAHAVEAEDATGRMWRKQRKLAARLGAEHRTDPHPPRPKGMHQRTYQRVLKRIWACEAWRDERLYLFMQRTGLAEVR